MKKLKVDNFKIVKFSPAVECVGVAQSFRAENPTLTERENFWSVSKYSRISKWLKIWLRVEFEPQLIYKIQNLLF